MKYKSFRTIVLIMLGCLAIAITGMLVLATDKPTYPQIIQDVKTLVTNTNEWYSFNLTNDDLILSDNDLLIRGGDCKDWAEYYTRHLSQYDTKINMVKIDNLTLHAYVVVSDNEAFCVINLNTFSCWKYTNQ